MKVAQLYTSPENWLATQSLAQIYIPGLGGELAGWLAGWLQATSRDNAG